MADTGGDDNKPRVTVELVGAKVDEVKAIVAGHAKVTETELGAIKASIGPLAGLPERTARLEEKVETVASDVQDIKDEKKSHKAWVKGAVVTFALFATGTFINLSVALHWFGGH